jgi:GTP-binding protein
VDVAPYEGSGDPVKDAKAIVNELKKFSPELYERERWLVLNKLDLLPPEDREARCKAIIKGLKWKGPVFRISAIGAEGTRELCQKVMERLEQLGLPAEADTPESRE